MLYKKWAEQWLEDKSRLIKPASYQTYMYLIKAHLVPCFGEFEVENLDEELVVDVFWEWEEEGLSPKTRRDLQVLLKSTLNAYSKITGIKLKPINFRLTRVDYSNIRFFEKEDQKKIIYNIYKNPKPKSIGIALGLCAGLRIGEVCALRWKDIDLKHFLIKINGTVQRIYNKNSKTTEVKRDSSKTRKSTRIIPLNSTLKILLSIINENDPEAFVITGKRKCIEPKTIREFYYNFLKKNNIEILTFHSLRHSFGTQAIRCGIDPKTLQEVMGHSSIEITLSLYVHPQLDDKRIAMEKLSQQWL